jgi:hypothetical protein
MHTPWGASQDSKQYGKGITFYSTASHGGFKVIAELLAKMPDYLRSSEPRGDARRGTHEWFEEDCEWCFVATCFPERFSEQERAAAKDTLRNSFPDEYEKFYNVVLEPGDSYTRDKRLFKAAHAADYLVLSAFGDWHKGVPKGMVGVFAGKGGRTEHGHYPDDCKWFLVPDEEYRPGMVLSCGSRADYQEIKALA